MPGCENGNAEYYGFRRRYLLAFLAGCSADWLKGPYIYKLYESRGFAQQEITILFVSGYVSSATFGLVAGSMCDALGRRKMCLVFCVAYILHCLLHASSAFWVLLLARAVSGVATALLFSAFEAWVVAEHGRLFPGRNIGDLFAVQTQGNAVTAFTAGLVSQVSVWLGGYTAPLVVAVPLLLCCALLVWQWEENVGSRDRQLGAVTRAVWRSLSPAVVKVGLMQCLFEASMHIFIFLWTPCLQKSRADVPHGVIFAAFMAFFALGGRQAAVPAVRPSLGVVFLVSAGCLCLPSVNDLFWPNLACFCAFEWGCGCYYPQIATLRSRYFHEEVRGATISLFRVPLNAVVVLVLIYGRSMPPSTMLRVSSLLLTLAAGICFSLRGDAKREERHIHPEEKKIT